MQPSDGELLRAYSSDRSEAALKADQSGSLLARNLSLSNEVHQLRTRLALLEQPARSNPREAAVKPVPQAEDRAHQLALAALQGDVTALEKLAEMAKVASRDNHPDMTPEEQTKLVEKLQPIWSAFHLFAEEAGTEQETAIDALISFSRSTNQSVRTAVLAGLNAAAARQNQKAVEAVRQLQRNQP
jgi:hypothetical protein